MDAINKILMGQSWFIIDLRARIHCIYPLNDSMFREAPTKEIFKDVLKSPLKNPFHYFLDLRASISGSKLGALQIKPPLVG